jgi:hypothetical protein
VEVKIKEELRMKKRHDKPPVGLHLYMGLALERPAPIGHPVLRTLPVAK